jgi:hypothetical protein
MNYRTLSNREILRQASVCWDPKAGLPVDMQRDLLRRFAEVAPLDEHPYIDPNQLKLPL